MKTLPSLRSHIHLWRDFSAPCQDSILRPCVHLDVFVHPTYDEFHRFFLRRTTTSSTFRPLSPGTTRSKPSSVGHNDKSCGLTGCRSLVRAFRIHSYEFPHHSSTGAGAIDQSHTESCI